MNNVLHELFSEKISDEAAYHIVNFLYNADSKVKCNRVAKVMLFTSLLADSLFIYNIILK